MTKPEVIRSSVLGYCMGVSRAVKIAEALAVRRDTLTGKPAHALYTYGPLIHNTTVLRKLEEKGVHTLGATEFIESIAPSTSITSIEDGAPLDLHGALVIIRAHGVAPHVEAKLREAGAVIKDATCPKVKANQLLARKLCMENTKNRKKENGISPVPVFLAGDRWHAEIQGILGYAPDCICVSNEAEAEEAARSRTIGGHNTGKNEAALIGQTTFPVDDYRKIAAVLQKYFRLDVKDTICPATSCRQDALRILCASVDAMIVAGGKDSANTRALAEIAHSMGVPVYLIENAAEMKPIEPELAAYRRIGLAAGASTPLEIIDELEIAVLKGRYSVAMD
jgi:4-hydroxy-3-methylbut-2-enyl diphosphate reductase